MVCIASAAYFFPHVIITPALPLENEVILDTNGHFSDGVKIGGYFVVASLQHDADDVALTLMKSDKTVRGCIELKLGKPDIEPHYVDPRDCIQ